MMDEFELNVNRLFAGYACSKIAILGIGNELRRDDAVGLAVVDQLSSFMDDPSVIVLNCQNSPENYTGYLKRVKPTCVVLVDAADFGAIPGDVRIFQLNDLEGSSISTHKASLLALGEYLQTEINCNIFVIGIQPADCDFGDGLSPLVRRASVTVAESIRTAINRFRAKRSEVKLMATREFRHLPWIVPYGDILAIAGTGCVELIETTNCYGGAAWARYHYAQTSPLILASRTLGNTTRYLIKEGTSHLKLRASVSAGGIESVMVSKDTIKVTYAGLGGGGVGATMCRALARDVIDYDLTPAGGSKLSRGTLTLPKRFRVIIGVDDTDTKHEGATWSLVNNIAAMVDSESLRYVSHAIVQLYPVKAKTKNCVATVVEFASLNDDKPIKKFKKLLEELSLSDKTGMAVLKSFSAERLLDFGNATRSGEVSISAAIEAANAAGVKVCIEGRGIIGAIAALPFFSQSDESVKLDKIMHV